MRLSHIEIDPTGLPTPSPDMAQECRVVIADVLEDNTFVLAPAGGDGRPSGPYHLRLGLYETRLVFAISTEDGERVAEFHLSLSPFRQVIKDYWQICDSYFAAVKTLHPAQIEAIDMARRGIHDEGARVLHDRLTGKAQVDKPTARRLFTLICALNFRD